MKKQPEQETEKKTGAQPHNLNAGKMPLPTLQRIKDGEPVPLTDEGLRDVAGEMVLPYVEDLGGDGNIGAGHRIIIGALTDLIHIRLTVMQQMMIRGAILQDLATGAWGLQPAVEKLSTFVSTEARLIRLLGLSRKPRRVSDLQSYIENKQKGAKKGRSK